MEVNELQFQSASGLFLLKCHFNFMLKLSQDSSALPYSWVTKKRKKQSDF